MGNLNIKELNSIWDEFLNAWPVERVKKMTLDEYTKSGDQTTFTYWMESKLDKLGSIWGGSAFKFGVYSRSNQETKEIKGHLSIDGRYGWVNKYGDSPEKSFEVVRGYIINVIA